jgi:hypothetical protein
MLLTISSTRPPATDLGHLLHKHPQRLQSFPLPFGQAHVFYPEATDSRCTAALLLDVDPVGLIRRGVRFPRLDQYVNDRPYVASSFMSVAIARVFSTALAGKCTARPELPDEPLPLSARIPALPCRGGEDVLRSTPPSTRLTSGSPNGARARISRLSSKATCGCVSCSRICTCSYR